MTRFHHVRVCVRVCVPVCVCVHVRVRIRVCVRVSSIWPPRSSTRHWKTMRPCKFSPRSCSRLKYLATRKQQS
ncbi:hypothetical protein BC937DRAFT_94404 [Endogone sp. FLAS-F59071]|nr:hypothetical protein BC937DRAFT_94404 [Endogone sp. FLAS-F59071]|eukprot:RUS14066.1 hypothetical protein BC937DRAFT_94404 [Endogone sp. FLAS-F59071]